VTDLAGRGRYTLDQGFEASTLRGSILGDRVELDVKADEEGVEVRGSGKLQTQHVARLAGIEFSEALLSGASSWTVIVRNQDDSLTVDLETDGIGLISDLPMPLTKIAARAEPIRVRLIDDATSRRFEASVFDDTDISGRLDETPMALNVKTPELDVLGWASLPGDSETGPNLSLLIDVEQLNAGETSLQVDTLAVTLGTGSVEAYVEGRDVEGRVTRIGQAPVRVELGYLMLPEAGEFLDPPGDDPLLDYDPGLIPSAEIQIATLARGLKEYRDLEATLISGDHVWT
jgi:Predicted membrane protein